MSDVNRALNLASEIEEVITEIAEEFPQKYDRGIEFFENVNDKAQSIAETISERGQVSNAQINALENMLSGVRRWLEG